MGSGSPDKIKPSLKNQEETNMKKSLIPILGILLLLTSFYFGHQYLNGPKIIEGQTAKEPYSENKDLNFAKEFQVGEPIYFVAEGNRFYVDEATVVWYQGEIKSGNRIKEEKVEKKDGYFTAELSLSEEMEPGIYGVGIFAKGNKVMETKALFKVNK